MSEPQKPEGKRPKTATTEPRHAKAATAGPQKKATSSAATKAPMAKKNMSLAALAEGMPGLTAACGQTLAEAAAVCLEDRKHQTGVCLPRAGLMIEDLHVEWLPVDDQNRRCYADMQEATERGACGVATAVRRGETKQVAMTQALRDTPTLTPKDVLPDEEKNKGKPDEDLVQLRGELQIANATKKSSKQSGEIEIVTEGNVRVKVVVPPGMMSDIVKPLWESEVEVTGTRKGKKVHLMQIRPAS